MNCWRWYSMIYNCAWQESEFKPRLKAHKTLPCFISLPGPFSSSPLRRPRAMNLRTVPDAVCGCCGALSPCLCLSRGTSVKDSGLRHTHDATPASRSLPASRAARRLRSDGVSADSEAASALAALLAASCSGEYTGAGGRLIGASARTPEAEPAHSKPAGARGS
jgi:hypothetical protein